MKNGFTLIELLVVIALVALLSSVVLASLTAVRVKARGAKASAEFREIDMAFKSLINDGGCYPREGVVEAERTAYYAGGGTCSFFTDAADWLKVDTVIASTTALAEFLPRQHSKVFQSLYPELYYDNSGDNEATDCASGNYAEGVNVYTQLLLADYNKVYPILEQQFDSTPADQVFTPSALNCGRIQGASGATYGAIFYQISRTQTP